MQIILNYIGGDASTYGLSVFLYCVGEFLLMRLASRLLRRGMPRGAPVDIVGRPRRAGLATALRPGTFP